MNFNTQVGATRGSALAGKVGPDDQDVAGLHPLLADCLERLNLFRLSRQLDVITSVFASHVAVGTR